MLAAAGLMAALLVGPVLVVVLVVRCGWRLGKDARRVELTCWERLELEERAKA